VTHLIDTSVWHRYARSAEVRNEVDRLVSTGALLTTCPVVVAEYCFSARNEAELSEVISVYHSPLPIPHSLTVGFNRRFSPHTKKLKELLKSRSGPLCMNMTINAGEIPPITGPRIRSGEGVGLSGRGVISSTSSLIWPEVRLRRSRR